MRSVGALAVTLALSLLAISASAQGGEPKQGGILRIYHRDSPGSASIHEGATYSVNVPFMPVFNNLVIYKQDVAQNSMDTIVPDLAESWAWGADNKTLTFKLRHGAKGHVATKGPPEPAQGLVRTGQRRHDQWRFRGRLQPEAAAAFAARTARLRLHADLSLPHLAGGDADASDRHRPVQIRRVQGQ